MLASLLVAWRSHGDNSAMKSLTSGAKRSNLDLPVISALAIVFNATTQQMQLSAAQGCFRRREWPVTCSTPARARYRVGCWPRWGSKPVEFCCSRLLVKYTALGDIIRAPH